MTVPAVCAVTVPAVAAAVAVGGAVSAGRCQQDDSGDGEERRPPALTAPARLTDAWAEPAAEDKFLKVPPRCRAPAQLLRPVLCGVCCVSVLRAFVCTTLFITAACFSICVDFAPSVCIFTVDWWFWRCMMPRHFHTTCA